MKACFDRIAIVGLGLLGGSVGLAARSRGVVRQVCGASRRRETLEDALSRGVVDEIHVDLSRAVAGAELVVLATPPLAMAGVVRRMASGLEAGTIVTDVASVKASVAEVLPGLLPPGVHYVGAHPMAGSHERGLAHARPDLFENAPCIVCPGPSTDPGAVAQVQGFWESLGAQVWLRDPEAHDAQVAWVSHLPHAAAFAFARAFSRAPAAARPLAGAGFHDFTRIAKSDPELWAEILTANRKALAGPLHQVAEGLAVLARSLEVGDGDAIERFIREGREVLARSTTPSSRGVRSGGADPEIGTVG